MGHRVRFQGGKGLWECERACWWCQRRPGLSWLLWSGAHREVWVSQGFKEWDARKGPGDAVKGMGECWGGREWQMYLRGERGGGALWPGYQPSSCTGAVYHVTCMCFIPSVGHAHLPSSSVIHLKFSSLFSSHRHLWESLPDSPYPRAGLRVTHWAPHFSRE